MARPAFTNEVHQLHGTKSQSKAATESHVAAGRPKMPADIRQDPTLRKVFKGLVKLLAERRALSKGDVELIRLYVYAYDRHKRNVELLREEGEICTYYRLNSNGESVPQVKENLRVKLCAGAEKQMAAILSQLGLSPTAKDRARPTSGQPASSVVPGSLADTNPDLFSGGKVTRMPFVPPVPLEIPVEEEGEV